MTSPALPIDYDAIRTALVRTLQSAMGLDQQHVLMAEPEQAGWPRPSKPYFTVKIVNAATRFGDDVPDQVGSASPLGTISRNYGGPRGMMVSFNCYGNTHEQASSLMVLWQGMLDTELTQESLGVAGIAVWKQGEVRDLSELHQAGYEGRSQMDVFFGLASNLLQEIPYIAAFKVVGNETQ